MSQQRPNNGDRHELSPERSLAYASSPLFQDVRLHSLIDPRLPPATPLVTGVPEVRSHAFLQSRTAAMPPLTSQATPMGVGERPCGTFSDPLFFRGLLDDPVGFSQAELVRKTDHQARDHIDFDHRAARTVSSPPLGGDAHGVQHGGRVDLRPWSRADKVQCEQALFGVVPREQARQSALPFEEGSPHGPCSQPVCASLLGKDAPDASTAILRDAAALIASLSGALQNSLQAPMAARASVRVPIPMYRGYDDPASPNEFLDSLRHYGQASGLSEEEMLRRVLPAALTGSAARWFRLVGQNAESMDEFRANFRQEFLPADYTARLRRELEARTQHPDESLIEYVRTMQEFYSLADPNASHEEQVERVVRQAHPTFAAYLRSSKFRNLDELALEAKRLQSDILASRAYRPPPPAYMSLEPRCAWKGDSTFHSQSGHATAYAVSNPLGASGPFEISDRALDPYGYGRRVTAPKAQPPREVRPCDRTNRTGVPNPGRQASNARADGGRLAGNPSSDVRCFRCNERGHMSRNCPDFPQNSGNE